MSRSNGVANVSVAIGRLLLALGMGSAPSDDPRETAPVNGLRMILKETRLAGKWRQGALRTPAGEGKRDFFFGRGPVVRSSCSGFCEGRGTGLNGPHGDGIIDLLFAVETFVQFEVIDGVDLALVLSRPPPPHLLIFRLPQDGHFVIFFML